MNYSMGKYIKGNIKAELSYELAQRKIGINQQFLYSRLKEDGLRGGEGGQGGRGGSSTSGCVRSHNNIGHFVQATNQAESGLALPLFWNRFIGLCKCFFPEES